MKRYQLQASASEGWIIMDRSDDSQALVDFGLQLQRDGLCGYALRVFDTLDGTITWEQTPHRDLDTDDPESIGLNFSDERKGFAEGQSYCSFQRYVV